MESLHERIVEIGRANPDERSGPSRYLSQLDYSILQQCIHCGLCLPTCPTYDETKLERNSPRGRIALMRSIADGALPVSEAFGEELYFCLGCLACETACPAGVKYALMFENARADIERAGVLKTSGRSIVRSFALRFVFTRPAVLRTLARVLYLFQRSGLQWFARKTRLMSLLPKRLRELEPLTPVIQTRFSDAAIHKTESPANQRYRVGMLTGCIQDVAYSDVNRDTVDVLLANGCEVITPRGQYCCGSLHAHNGELEIAKMLARRNIDSFDLTHLDAIISNAAGCGSHLKAYAHLLHGDPIYAERAVQWSLKVKDIHEWLVKIGFVQPGPGWRKPAVTYHEACHLCHGQKITLQPRQILVSVAELVELPESDWCCGSAGVYNITQPEMSYKLLQRKLAQLDTTMAKIVVTSNPGCILQLRTGIRQTRRDVDVMHTISLLAQAYRNN
jgi:glycolate oxidase iron-sulfur subunit